MARVCCSEEEEEGRNDDEDDDDDDCGGERWQGINEVGSETNQRENCVEWISDEISYGCALHFADGTSPERCAFVVVRWVIKRTNERFARFTSLETSSCSSCHSFLLVYFSFSSVFQVFINVSMFKLLRAQGGGEEEEEGRHRHVLRSFALFE